MDPAEFTNPNGKILSNSDGHVTFLPNPLPPAIHYDSELVMTLVHAERKVAELKGKGELLTNPHILIRPYLKREAVVSSKIEGTLASLTDLLQYEAVGGLSENESERLGIVEVVNYVEALQEMIDQIRNKNRKIDLNMIKEAHHMLMEDVRGENKKPGEFRTVQNWIVRYGDNAENSVYTPPPPEHVMDLLQQFEEFLHNPPPNISVLIQCALLHYQFEAIHPFADGNGRIGRVLISLLLAERGLLPQPLLYLSAYFEKHLEDYYKGLLYISQKNKWREWLKFFLQALTVQAEEAINNIQRLMDLQKKYKKILRESHVSGSAVLLVDSLFENPYMTVPKAMKFLKLTYPSAKNAVYILVEAGILDEISIRYRSKVFLAKEIEAALHI